MISVIILSYRKAFLDKLLTSIAQTIGTEYETVVVHNLDGQYSICSAYNEGVSRSKFDYLCFVHEDVVFKTENWGSTLVNEMEQNPKLGMIGVMGAKFKSKYPTGWYNPVNNCKYLVGNIFQGKNSDSSVELMDYSPDRQEGEGVVCIDGVFMFSKKEIFSECLFDEKMLNGYHGYDLDISLQILNKGYQLMVFKNIQLFHFSTGSPDKEWERYNQLISEKWKHFLPVSSSLSNTKLHLAFREFETVHIHDSNFYAKKILLAPLRLIKSIWSVLTSRTLIDNQ
jgi:GT2 family glycosyltransferase